jgi:hypothetical protein
MRFTPEVRISAGMCSSGSRETAVNFSAKRRMRPDRLPGPAVFAE